MIIIFWIVMIIALCLLIFNKHRLLDVDYHYLKIISGMIILILLIVTIFCIDGVARDVTIPDKIGLYEEQNTLTEANIKYWLEDLNASESNEIVQAHRNIIKENNKKITKLKEEHIINKKYNGGYILEIKMGYVLFALCFCIFINLLLLYNFYSTMKLYPMIDMWTEMVFSFMLIIVSIIGIIFYCKVMV